MGPFSIFYQNQLCFSFGWTLQKKMRFFLPSAVCVCKNNPYFSPVKKNKSFFMWVTNVFFMICVFNSPAFFTFLTAKRRMNLDHYCCFFWGDTSQGNPGNRPWTNIIWTITPDLADDYSGWAMSYGQHSLYQELLPDHIRPGEYTAGLNLTSWLGVNSYTEVTWLLLFFFC